jgi:predicted RNase H-like nuclease (RuvC/YqgF family)
MAYNSRWTDDGSEVTDPRERLDEAIERITHEAKHLADQFDNQVKYLAKRHGLIFELMKLEKLADVPIKTLEKRVGLLQQIRAYPAFAGESLERLKDRITCIQTINRLEPNGEHAPIKKLRERARLLERVAASERVAAEPGLDDDDEGDEPDFEEDHEVQP